jgi:hypothetical protein
LGLIYGNRLNPVGSDEGFPGYTPARYKAAPCAGNIAVGDGFIPARVAFSNHVTLKTTLHCLFIGADGNQSRLYDRGSDQVWRLKPYDFEIFHRAGLLEKPESIQHIADHVEAVLGQIGFRMELDAL